MAWLNNLAEKAEHFLDRLDHQASVVLLQNDRRNDTFREDTGVDYYDLSLDLTDNVLENKSACRKDDDSILMTESPEETVISMKDDNYLLNDESNNKMVTNDLLDKFNKQRQVIEELERKNAEQLSKYSKCLDQIADLQKKVQEYKNKNISLNNQVKETVSSLTLTQKEVEKHRKQAENNLEEKEKYFGSTDNTTFNKNKTNEQKEYILKLIKARDDQEKKITELSEKLEILRNDLIINQKYCSMYKEEASTVRQNLQKEQRIRLNLEDEVMNNKKEINRLYEDLKKHINLLNSKNEELINLQKQVDNQYSSNENGEIESKFHVLTKTLIMKQNSLETLTTERNALRLQLERLKADYVRVLTELNSKQKSLQSNSLEENGRSPDIFDIPFNESLSQRVKRTLTTLNTFSIRLGVFLRRYPVARIFLLCYMILLQIWVVVILFAYVPNTY